MLLKRNQLLFLFIFISQYNLKERPDSIENIMEVVKLDLLNDMYKYVELILNDTLRHQNEK